MPQTMLDEHRQLRELAADLSHLLDSKSDVTPEIARARWSLTRVLMRHIAQERTVFARLAAERPIGAIVEQHGQRADRLHAEAERHLRDWTPERINTFFPLFRVEMRRLLRALEDSMRLEETAIYATPARAPAQFSYARA